MIWGLAHLRPGKIKETRLALQFTGLALLISVLPLVVFYLSSYSTTEHTIVDLAAQQNRQILSNQKDYLALQLDQIEALAANLSQVEEVSSTLERSNTQTSESIYDTLATKARMGYLLSNYSNLNGLVSIDIFTIAGKHYHVGDTLINSGERETLRDILWERTIKSTRPITWHGVEDNVQITSASQKVVSATRMLFSTKSSWLKAEPIAMLLVNFSTDYLYQQFSKVNLGKGAFMLVVDEQHRLIYHPDRAKIGWQIAPEFGALLQETSGSLIRRLGQTDVLLNVDTMTDKNWHIISVTPMETLLAPMSRLRRDAGLILFVMVATILVFLRLFTSRLVKPIEDIAEGFKNFQSNKIVEGWRMPQPRSLDAIKNLTRWFNIFLDNMEQRRESDIRLRIAATAFESHEAMFVADARHTILQTNSALATLTGYCEAEMVGKKPDIFSAHRQGTAIYDDILQAIESTGTWQGEVLNRRKCGEFYPAWLAVTAVRDKDKKFSHFVAALSDITLRKANEDAIRNLAFYDPLTGLANRRLLTDRLLQAMLDCPRRKQSIALILLDLHKFKAVNDSLGHDAGDALLKCVGQRVSSCVRDVDTVARLGGDEFVVLIEGLSSSPEEAAAQVELVALKILRSLAEPYDDVGSGGVYCSASIGITLFSEPGREIDELMKQADLALYQAKEAGPNNLRFFDPDMQARIVARASLESDMRQGLLRGEFKVYFQVKVDAHQEPIGAEVLVRWQHPRRGLVLPAAFIGLAEETGAIVPLGRLVFGAACAQLRSWAARPDRRDLGLSVNVSPKEFLQADFVANLLGILDDSGADPDMLTLEITENLLIDNIVQVIEKMAVLRHRGISFAIDDFGTGYSSLGYLKRMPLRELKIDRSFVRDMLSNSNDASIVRIVIALGHELGLDVVAEGIETPGQFDFLKTHGCRTFQGYLFGAPMPLDEFEAMLRDTAQASERNKLPGEPVRY